MTLLELFGSNYSLRKTVWSKKGNKITRRVVDREMDFVHPKTRFEIVKGKDYAEKQI